jgi:siroheme synthase-like protein
VPYFPLFIDLTGRLCVVAGGGQVAARKAAALADFGARVGVFDPEPSQEMRELAARGVTIHKRPCSPADLTGAAMVIAATNDKTANARIARAAAEAHIPVNAADDPRLCGFFFPAIVQRGNLVAGISTSGDCPRFAARLREKLDNEWPESFTQALEKLKAERARLKAECDSAEVLRRLDLIISQIIG